MIRQRLFIVLPLAVFAVLGWFLWQGLSGEPSRLPSTLINKPIPQFDLPAVPGLSVPGLKSADIKGQVTIVNIWASWCGPCREEHPILMLLSKRNDIRLVGINNKDNPENATRFIGTFGQPFSAVGADPKGRITIDWGGYGVPESFIIDAQGIIRHKHIGAITPNDVIGKFGAEIEKAKKPL